VIEMLVEMVEFIWRELKQREEEAWNAYQKNRDDEELEKKWLDAMRKHMFVSDNWKKMI